MPDLISYLVVAVGAGLGGAFRYFVTFLFAQWLGGDFPYGTFAINVSGAFVIGVALTLLLTVLQVNQLWRLFFVTGFLGGYTTFSSYAWEALTLMDSGRLAAAALYVAGSNVVGLLGVWLGATLTRTIWFTGG